MHNSSFIDILNNKFSYMGVVFMKTLLAILIILIIIATFLVNHEIVKDKINNLFFHTEPETNPKTNISSPIGIFSITLFVSGSPFCEHTIKELNRKRIEFDVVDCRKERCTHKYYPTMSYNNSYIHGYVDIIEKINLIQNNTK